MHNCLNTVKEEECKVRHLGNVEKHEAMALKNVSITDIFRKAEELHVQQTTDGNMRWQLALDMGNANSAQTQSDKPGNDKRFKRKNNLKKKFNQEMNGDRKGMMQPRKSWKNVGPEKGDKSDHCKGNTPIFKKTVKG